MSTKNCLPFHFVGICKNAFYFKGTGEDEDLDEDRLQKDAPCKFYWIQSHGSKFLIYDEDKFEAQPLSIYEQRQSECKFCIQTYKFITEGNKKDEKKGTTVVLYTKTDGKIMVACCSENEIKAEEMNLPDEIEEDQHKVVFLLKKIPSASNTFMFESYEKKGKFLAFEPEYDSSFEKLVLRSKVDEVDVGCEWQLSVAGSD
ncbi:interleukin-18-like [Thunnus maccoyii]|uniref:interleukin-18-like n=1 Tax=Thunnus maccoyii TaxID=8240 RepID=UPI001C4D6D53|nr:interleukin-18-like [Thunnus maccoyii]XP_042269362.1 interleukin-18-like [Thunnus maccoyii]XP_042269363.1 interleukin-18-like [Thunnus maccoyii]XP_042269364.1 interleukin-18-like [Thunnus maccoyii]